MHTAKSSRRYSLVQVFTLSLAIALCVVVLIVDAEALGGGFKDNDTANILSAAEEPERVRQVLGSGPTQLACKPESVETGGYMLACHPGIPYEPAGSPGSVQNYNPTVTVLPNHGGTQYSWPIVDTSQVGSPTVAGWATVTEDQTVIQARRLQTGTPGEPNQVGHIISVVIPHGKTLKRADLRVANLR